MERFHKLMRLNFFVTILLILASENEPIVASNASWVGSKYQIECTMCSACDNPCNTPLSPPPPPPSPSPPPPTPPSSNCPPPPSPPSSNGYYYSPPPPSPSQPTYTYSSPPPPGGVIGGLYPPSPYKNFPAPPPPNPIVSYFPFYYHSPPPPNSSTSVRLSGYSVFYTIALFFSLLCLFF